VVGHPVDGGEQRRVGLGVSRVDFEQADGVSVGIPEVLDGERHSLHPDGLDHCAGGVAQPGFVVDEAEVVFWGYCPTCQSIREASPTQESSP